LGGAEERVRNGQLSEGILIWLSEVFRLGFKDYRRHTGRLFFASKDSRVSEFRHRLDKFAEHLILLLICPDCRDEGFDAIGDAQLVFQ
jgi:hypothetical protein